jgi:polysaccharide lyase-like protein
MRFRSLIAVAIAAALLLAALAAPAQGREAGKTGVHRLARLADNVALKRKPHRRPSRSARSAHEANPDVLFYGDQVGDFAMNQSAPGAVSEVSDPAGTGQSVMEMTVRNSDVAPVTPTSDPRAQLLSPSIIDDGEEFWWSGRFFLPADFPSSVPGWLTVMEGPYGAPFDGTPPWHIEVNGDTIQWARNDTYDYDIPWQMPLVRNRWVDVVVHERFSQDGWVEMWIDGQQITFFEPGTYNPNDEPSGTRLSMATRDHSNDGGPNFTVIQSYRKAGMFSSVSLFQGPMSIGTTKAAVE